MTKIESASVAERERHGQTSAATRVGGTRCGDIEINVLANMKRPRPRRREVIPAGGRYRAVRTGVPDEESGTLPPARV